ncbi:hypothetical protein FE257_004590 [Aspergillus nanangensis]|uniref:Uncharacterized protein n=1 Tax=Aspergillus nanangensis TaxID=2582783 RepID=A0AAD4CYP4_ASPNN|nr:hypothetical protein FE257_004590 [Aspergillus nanangensis]
MGTISGVEVESVLASEPVSPDNLAYTDSALAAFDELRTAKSNVELLHASHRMWCGSTCSRDKDCHFLHYIRPECEGEHARAPRSRYNKDTSHLYGLMGGTSYVPNTQQTHRVNSWPLLDTVLTKADVAREHNGMLHCDYTDWSKKNDMTAEQTVRYLCRDSIQWMGTWCGADYAASLAGLHYLALAAITDDICIPPLDLLSQRFRMYGFSARDVIETMVNQGWGRDATHALLALVREYLLQYAEKVDFGKTPKVGLHSALSQSIEVWDSVVYRTHTANCYGVGIVVCRIAGSSPLTETWLNDAAICDCVSMDLCKSTLRIYQHDDHAPTAGNAKDVEVNRKAGYHSVYLDLIDDLVFSGAPESAVHYGRAGFLFVQIVDRYLERRAGHRFPIRPSMDRELHRLFGDEPTDTLLDGIFRLRQLGNPDHSPQSSLSPALLSVCQLRQQQRRLSYDCGTVCKSEESGIGTYRDSTCSCARDWIDRVHLLGQEAISPSNLQELISEKLGAFSLSAAKIASVGPLKDIWALCVGCHVHCGGRCEWLAFAEYAWQEIWAGAHAHNVCHADGNPDITT